MQRYVAESLPQLDNKQESREIHALRGGSDAGLDPQWHPPARRRPARDFQTRTTRAYFPFPKTR
jgi:hypothetical protein